MNTPPPTIFMHYHCTSITKFTILIKLFIYLSRCIHKCKPLSIYINY
nr:MAG TPA: hypothetical protein [Caudoviricetes sp.]